MKKALNKALLSFARDEWAVFYVPSFSPNSILVAFVPGSNEVKGVAYLIIVEFWFCHTLQNYQRPLLGCPVL